jgi:hypothetical protein
MTSFLDSLARRIIHGGEPPFSERLNQWKQQRAVASSLSANELSKWLEVNPEPMLSEKEHKELAQRCLSDAYDRNRARSRVYCPIAGAPCKVECECYIKAIAHGTCTERDEITGEIVIPWVSDGRCTAYILKGGPAI